MHILPDGFHRIRHYGLLASAQRKTNIAKVRALIGASAPEQEPPSDDDPKPLTLREPCPCCSGTMLIIETFKRGQIPRYCSLIPPAADRLVQPHRTNSLVLSDPADRIKPAIRQLHGLNMTQTRSRNAKTNACSLSNNASFAVTGTTDSTLSS